MARVRLSHVDSTCTGGSTKTSGKHGRQMSRRLVFFFSRLFIVIFTFVLDVNWDEFREMNARNADFVETFRPSLSFSLKISVLFSFSLSKPSFTTCDLNFY